MRRAERPWRAALIFAAGVGSLAACARAGTPSSASRGVTLAPSVERPRVDEPRELSSSPSPCQVDADCGYDARWDRCGSDPGLNRQPPLVDQGVICYCDAEARVCSALRVWPVPCEGDASCAVRLTPRPHPVAASPELPHERGVRCKDYRYRTTCERTNICTMHELRCP